MSSTDRVKNLLERGRKLTVVQIDRMCSTNNSPEILSRLRKQGMQIHTEWRTNKNTGKRFGVYQIAK